MNQPAIGSTVQLTESAKASPFWRGDRYRNQRGKVTGIHRPGVFSVKLGERGIPKTFYIAAESLEVAP